MNPFSRYDASVVFLSGHVDDWAGLIELVGPCRRDPKAAQQLTAKAGHAIIGRIKGLFDGRDFSTPEDLIAAEFEPLRAWGFSAARSRRPSR
jgi:DNA-3-methyladenine glycosylase II